MESHPISEASNNLPCWFYVAPDFFDLGPMLWKQIHPQLDHIHPILVDEESEPTQQHGPQASSEVRGCSLHRIRHRDLISIERLPDHSHIKELHCLDAEHNIPAECTLSHFGVHVRTILLPIYPASVGRILTESTLDTDALR